MPRAFGAPRGGTARSRNRKPTAGADGTVGEAAKKAAPKKVKKWSLRPDDPLVILRGGRRDGWVYYESDMMSEARSNVRAGLPNLYIPTTERVPHPKPILTDGAWCNVWVYVLKE